METSRSFRQSTMVLRCLWTALWSVCTVFSKDVSATYLKCGGGKTKCQGIVTHRNQQQQQQQRKEIARNANFCLRNMLRARIINLQYLHYLSSPTTVIHSIILSQKKKHTLSLYRNRFDLIPITFVKDLGGYGLFKNVRHLLWSCSIWCKNHHLGNPDWRCYRLVSP